MYATYVLHPGDSVSTNRISLVLQSDGDLVLRDEDGRAVWSSGTHAAGASAVFQADGNLVVYGPSNASLWSSNTSGHDGATMVLRADGDLVITYGGRTIWSTRTAK